MNISTYRNIRLEHWVRRLPASARLDLAHYLSALQIYQPQSALPLVDESSLPAILPDERAWATEGLLPLGCDVRPELWEAMLQLAATPDYRHDRAGLWQMIGLTPWDLRLCVSPDTAQQHPAGYPNRYLESLANAKTADTERPRAGLCNLVYVAGSHVVWIEFSNEHRVDLALALWHHSGPSTHQEEDGASLAGLVERVRHGTREEWEWCMAQTLRLRNAAIARLVEEQC